jgi:hypothetical protein
MWIAEGIQHDQQNEVRSAEAFADRIAAAPENSPAQPELQNNLNDTTDRLLQMTLDAEARGDAAAVENYARGLNSIVEERVANSEARRADQPVNPSDTRTDEERIANERARYEGQIARRRANLLAQRNNPTTSEGTEAQNPASNGRTENGTGNGTRTAGETESAEAEDPAARAAAEQAAIRACEQMDQLLHLNPGDPQYSQAEALRRQMAANPVLGNTYMRWLLNRNSQPAAATGEAPTPAGATPATAETTEPTPEAVPTNWAEAVQQAEANHAATEARITALIESLEAERAESQRQLEVIRAGAAAAGEGAAPEAAERDTSGTDTTDVIPPVEAETADEPEGEADAPEATAVMDPIEAAGGEDDDEPAAAAETGRRPNRLRRIFNRARDAYRRRRYPGYEPEGEEANAGPRNERERRRGGLVAGAAILAVGLVAGAYLDHRYNGGAGMHHVITKPPKGTTAPNVDALPANLPNVNLHGEHYPWNWAQETFGADKATSELNALVAKGQALKLPIKEVPMSDGQWAIQYGTGDKATYNTEDVVKVLNALRYVPAPKAK